VGPEHVIPIPKMITPPAIRKAPIVIEKSLRRASPSTANTINVTPAVTTARQAVRWRLAGGAPSVIVTKRGAVLKGLTMINTDEKASRANRSRTGLSPIGSPSLRRLPVVISTAGSRACRR